MQKEISGQALKAMEFSGVVRMKLYSTLKQTMQMPVRSWTITLKGFIAVQMAPYGFLHLKDYRFTTKVYSCFLFLKQKSNMIIKRCLQCRMVLFYGINTWSLLPTKVYW